MGSKKGAKPSYFDHLPADVLERLALLVPLRDRYKLNLVCRAWREGLADARQAWQEVVIDPRRKACTSRRVRLVKHLPTAAALGAWFARYGRHTAALHLRHLDAGSAAEGCAGEADLAALLRAAAPTLRQLTVHMCRVQDLLAEHGAAMRSLAGLTSLHIQLHPAERGLSLGTPQMDFVTCLTRLEDLALATGWGPQPRWHFLPASLAALPALRSLQLARLGEQRGIYEDPLAEVCALSVASCLTGLTALERLALSDFVLMEQEPHPPGWRMRLPPALWGLPGLTSLLLNDVGLGMLPRPPNAPPSTHGVYRLPNELRQLAPTLRELALTQHLCAPEELGVLSALTGLSALSMTARLRHPPTPVPEALSCLTGLAQLRISHGLTQVPPAITGLTQLTLLDLGFNSLRSLKPGPYLKRLVAVNLRGNLFNHFPQQLRVARHTAQELQLPQNDAMEITERDVEQLLTFECLRQLTIYGASEDKGTRRCLAALQKAMPWVLIDV